MTSLPIWLYFNFMAFVPNLTHTELRDVSMEHDSGRGMTTWKVYFSGPWFLRFLGLACAPIVETNFCKPADIFSDWRVSPITFSVLLYDTVKQFLMRVISREHRAMKMKYSPIIIPSQQSWRGYSNFTCTFAMIRGETLLIFGHGVKGQCQLWHCVPKTLWTR